MDVWIWVVLGGVVGVAIAVMWGRRARRVYVIDHVRVEMHPASVIEDRVIEAVWRAAISMTNVSRRPRVVPVLAERATVQAGRRMYLATVYLDADVREVNPGELALAWTEFTLPAERSPARVKVLAVSAAHRTKRLTAAAGGKSCARALRWSALPRHANEPHPTGVAWPS